MYRDAVRVGPRGVRLSWGGCNPFPYVDASGSSAVQSASWLRSAFTRDHRVSRADVCFDTVAEGAWESVTAAVEEIARSSGVAVLYVGDPDSVRGSGRTMYFGSTTSSARVRVYEKGRKERAAGDLSADPGWVRIELQYRPQRDGKREAAGVEPEGLWGCARWTAAVSERVLARVPSWSPPLAPERSPAEERLEHMLRQYGRTLREVERERGMPWLLHRITATISPVADQEPFIDPETGEVCSVTARRRH
ncbi:MAG: replication initiation factor domain-containing protein [bacterium]